MLIDCPAQADGGTVVKQHAIVDLDNLTVSVHNQDYAPTTTLFHCSHLIKSFSLIFRNILDGANCANQSSGSVSFGSSNRQPAHKFLFRSTVERFCRTDPELWCKQQHMITFGQVNTYFFLNYCYFEHS